MIKKNIPDHNEDRVQNDARIFIMEEKLNDFLKLLNESDINSLKIKGFEDKIAGAFKLNRLKHGNVEAFEALDNQHGLSREELLDNLDGLLSQHYFDSNITKKHSKQDLTKRTLLVLAGTVIITLGFAMIILPAPPYFEMFTVFYFNDNDGVTIMDIISLLIVFAGVYLVVVNMVKKNLG